MKIRTSELTGAALDWAVAECEGLTKRPDWAGKHDQRGNFVHAVWEHHYKPSTCWEYGGPILDREQLQLTSGIQASGQFLCWAVNQSNYTKRSGPTPLIAAMRCYVASVKGEEIDIPEELT